MILENVVREPLVWASIRVVDGQDGYLTLYSTSRWVGCCGGFNIGAVLRRLNWYLQWQGMQGTQSCPKAPKYRLSQIRDPQTLSRNVLTNLKNSKPSAWTPPNTPARTRPPAYSKSLGNEMAGFRSLRELQNQPSRFLRIPSMQPVSLALLCCRQVNGLVKYFLDPTNRLPTLPITPDPKIIDFSVVPAARLTASYSFEPIPYQTLPNSSICNHTRETHHRTSIIKDYIATWWPTRRHPAAYRY